MEDIIKTLRESKISLTKEDLRQINNTLVDISLSTDKMMIERDNIYKKIEEIKNILDTHAEIN
jgi:hypothetical protein